MSCMIDLLGRLRILIIVCVVMFAAAGSLAMLTIFI
jgi:hypothetical protein